MYEIVKFHRQIEGGSSIVAIPSSYRGPGDIVAGAFGWWGLRAYSLAKAGTVAINLRRDSDNATLDFRTRSNGSLDVSSIASWLGAANAFVTKLYDQTGNGNDLIQATGANQPSLILSGFGSFPTMRFGAVTTNWLITASGYSISQPYTVSFIAKRTTFDSSYHAVFSSYNEGGQLGDMECDFDNASGFMGAWGDTATELQLPASENVFHSGEAVFNTASSIFCLDGTNALGAGGNGAIGGGVGGPGKFSMGMLQPHGSESLIGDIFECGFWTSAFSLSQVAAVNSNKRSYWSV